MRKISLLFIVSSFIVAITNCDSDSDNEIENYSDYLTVEMKSISEIIEDTIYEIKISNSLNKTFEKECKLFFSLTNMSTNDYYMAEEKVINKKIADNPSLGFLNLQSGGHFTIVSNINELFWQSNDLDELVPGDFEFQITLFIDDPVSPYNMVHSNKLSYRRD